MREQNVGPLTPEVSRDILAAKASVILNATKLSKTMEGLVGEKSLSDLLPPGICEDTLVAQAAVADNATKISPAMTMRGGRDTRNERSSFPLASFKGICG